jgi:hypothetical protein
MTRPEQTEFAPFYANYVARVPQTNGLTALKESDATLVKLLKSMPPEMAHYRYAPGKWSVNEVVQHLIDAEIIFGYRALRIARGDKTPLAGFDENEYSKNTFVDSKSLAELILLFRQTRKSTLLLFGSFDASTHENNGIANQALISVRALCFITAGHTLHHASVLKERYL